MIFLIKNLHSSRMFAFKPSFMDDFHFPNLAAFLQIFPRRSKPRSVYPRYRRRWRSRWNRPEAHLAALGMAHMSDRKALQKTVMLMAGTIIIIVMMNTTIYWYWMALLLLASLLWSRWWWRWWWWWWRRRTNNRRKRSIDEHSQHQEKVTIKMKRIVASSITFLILYPRIIPHDTASDFKT